MRNQLVLEELVVSAKQGDIESMNKIIEIFTPLKKKYSRQLGYDDAYSDLVLWFIKAVHNCPIHKM